MSFDFVVIGATGLQGRIVSRDLIEHGYNVLLCGRNKSRILNLLKNKKQAKFKYLELHDHASLLKVLHGAKSSVVINCAEGDFNLEVQKACLRISAHYIDLGSDIPMTKDQFSLHQDFQKKRLCAITGCGSVPGIGNVMLRYASEKLDTIDSVDAGFAWTANKKVFVVPFSIISIIEELTDRPTVLKNKRFTTLEPLSGAHWLNFEEIKKQRVFLVRHPETYTFYRYLKNKGIKNIKFYAGFPDFSYNTIISFIKSGLGSREPNMDGVRPIDLLAKALKNTHSPKGYHEKENLWIYLSGKKNGKEKSIRMNCLVPTIKGWEEHGCNIDTGLPCSIIAQMVKEGIITSTGSRSPEFFVPVKPFFKAIAKRKMFVYENGKKIN